MSLLFDVPEHKKIRVIIDTDAACEADDPFAIAHALMSPKLIVKGLLAEHFNAEASMEESYQEIQNILEAMKLEIPIYKGQEGPLSQGMKSELKSDEISLLEEIPSEAVNFIIEEALKEDTHPLFILCLGAITNIALAIKICPEIINRMTVIWIGTQGEAPRKATFREFNAGNDVLAANIVLESGIDLWLVPSNVYSTIHIGIAEIQKRILPCGKIGAHLFHNMVDYNMTKRAGWTQGESWSLGDSPAVAIAINPSCGSYKYVKAPIIADDTASIEAEDRPMVRMYNDVDSRYILEDLIAKLELCTE